MFITTHKITELTPQHVSQTPSGHLVDSVSRQVHNRFYWTNVVAGGLYGQAELWSDDIFIIFFRSYVIYMYPNFDVWATQTNTFIFSLVLDLRSLIKAAYECKFIFSKLQIAIYQE